MQSIRKNCEFKRTNHNRINKNNNKFAGQKFWRTGTLLKFDEELTNLKKKLKLTNKGTIDFQRYKEDIVKRKEMLKQLN